MFLSGFAGGNAGRSGGTKIVHKSIDLDPGRHPNELSVRSKPSKQKRFERARNQDHVANLTVPGRPPPRIVGFDRRQTPGNGARCAKCRTPMLQPGFCLITGGEQTCTSARVPAKSQQTHKMEQKIRYPISDCPFVYPKPRKT